MNLHPLISEPLGLAPSFGFGDRIGLATPGHVAAMHAAGEGILPIFAQQSIREMTRTQRTPEQVMQEAMTAAAAHGWTGKCGADADHLKSTEDVDRTAAAGFTFFTIDPSDHVDEQADDYEVSALRKRFSQVQAHIDWFDSYRSRSHTLPTGTVIDWTEEACMRCAVKYGIAINEAVRLGNHIQSVCEAAERPFEIELSVDETNHPTTLAEHFIIADQCRRRGLKLISLAPRFIGDFEKGVDYQGNVRSLERSMRDHAAVAAETGPYKLSLHSGSDKLSMYAALARATGGRFHVKTAGTSYLEAVRVAARHKPGLFRRILEFARERYPVDKATYHVSAQVDAVPSPAEIIDDELLEELYLESWDGVPDGTGFTAPGRQILHCTFGSVLTDPELGGALRAVLEAYANSYLDLLANHFARHLNALRAGMS